MYVTSIKVDSICLTHVNEIYPIYGNIVNFMKRDELPST
jgi:hypothetical protein